MDPYAPPQAAVRPPKERLPPPLQWSIHAALGLKALQLAASLWLLAKGAPNYWSFADVGLHLSAATLLLKGRRVGIVFLLLALPLGYLVSLRDGWVVPARAVYLVGLPLLVLALAARYWATPSEPPHAP